MANEAEVKVLEGDDWDVRVLKQTKYFTVVLSDGTELRAKFVAGNRFNLLLETENAVLLLPKHSLRYVILRELDGGEELE